MASDSQSTNITGPKNQQSSQQTISTQYELSAREYFQKNLLKDIKWLDLEIEHLKFSGTNYPQFVQIHS